MNIVEITIKGISPLLMHAYPMVEINPPLEKQSIEKQAEYAAYRMPDKTLYFPNVNVARCLVAAATYSKGKGRASLQKQAAACMLVTPEHLSFETKNYEIDSRPVVIPVTKGRVMRHRPKLSSWQLTFMLEYDPTLLKEKEAREIMDNAGSRVGIGDFRPEKKGPFGRFMVTKWEATE
jgi:hypothetical protein